MPTETLLPTPLLVGFESNGRKQIVPVPHVGRLRYPHLERAAGTPDRLSPLAENAAGARYGDWPMLPVLVLPLLVRGYEAIASLFHFAMRGDQFTTFLLFLQPVNVYVGPPAFAIRTATSPWTLHRSHPVFLYEQCTLD